MNTSESPENKSGKYPTSDQPDSTKQKKRGSSRSARRLDQIETRVTNSMHRVSKAVDHGVSVYIEKRDKSAEKRRDGALVDFCENAAAGISKTLAESSPVLSDIAEAFNTRKRRKRLRRVMRGIPLL